MMNIITSVFFLTFILFFLQDCKVVTGHGVLAHTIMTPVPQVGNGVLSMTGTALLPTTAAVAKVVS